MTERGRPARLVITDGGHTSDTVAERYAGATGRAGRPRSVTLLLQH